MSDPRRFSEDDGLAGRVIGTVRRERPSAKARERAAAAIGISVGAAGVTAGGAATGATIAAGSGAAGGTAKAIAIGAWIKVVAAVVVTGGVIGVAADRLSSAPSETSSPTAVSSSPAPAPMRASASPRVDDIPPPEPVATVQRSASVQTNVLPTPPPSVAPRSSTLAVAAAQAPPDSPPAVRESESGLTRELRSLDGVRAALDRGDGAAALAALDRHEGAFPSGALQTEAHILRVEALLVHGDGAAARSLARELLARDPSRPHARRLRSIIGETGKADASIP